MPAGQAHDILAATPIKSSQGGGCGSLPTICRGSKTSWMAAIATGPARQAALTRWRDGDIAALTFPKAYSRRTDAGRNCCATSPDALVTRWPKKRSRRLPKDTHRSSMLAPPSRHSAILPSAYSHTYDAAWPAGRFLIGFRHLTGVSKESAAMFKGHAVPAVSCFAGSGIRADWRSLLERACLSCDDVFETSTRPYPRAAWPVDAAGRKKKGRLYT